MKWTVTRRIAGGYAVVLALLTLVAGVAWNALARTGDDFEAALLREGRLVGVMQAMEQISSANTDYLRYFLTPNQQHLTEWEHGISEGRRGLTELRDATSYAQLKNDLAEALALLNNFEELTKEGIAAKTAGHDADALSLRNERVVPVRQKLAVVGKRIVEFQRERSKEVAQSAVAGATRTIWVLLIVAGLALTGGVAIASALSRSISRSLSDTITTLASASSEIVASTTQQASGTAEEATSVRETSTTVDEVRQTTQVSAQKARAVAEAANETAKVSQDGRRAVDDSVKAIQEAKARMENLAERILALSEQGQAIGEIITSVNDLAEQSNLLSVNAAIEAAKAGEAGKGFAVVAAEVKALAEQSKQATAQVRGILNDIQRATQASVMAAEEGVKASASGVAVAAKAGEALRLLSDSLTESAQAAQQILVSAQQQVAGVDQIAVAMQNIQQASTQNMASTRQVERAAKDLNELAARLSALVTASPDGRRTRKDARRSSADVGEPERHV